MFVFSASVTTKALCGLGGDGLKKKFDTKKWKFTQNEELQF